MGSMTPLDAATKVSPVKWGNEASLRASLLLPVICVAHKRLWARQKESRGGRGRQEFSAMAELMWGPQAHQSRRTARTWLLLSMSFFQEAKQGLQGWLDLRGASGGPLSAPQCLGTKSPFTFLEAKKRQSQECIPLPAFSGEAHCPGKPSEKGGSWKRPQGESWKKKGLGGGGGGCWQVGPSCWAQLPPPLSMVLKAEAMAVFMLPSCCLDQSRHFNLSSNNSRIKKLLANQSPKLV